MTLLGNSKLQHLGYHRWVVTIMLVRQYKHGISSNSQSICLAVISTISMCFHFIKLKRNILSQKNSCSTFGCTKIMLKESNVFFLVSPILILAWTNTKLAFGLILAYLQICLLLCTVYTLNHTTYNPLVKDDAQTCPHISQLQCTKILHSPDKATDYFSTWRGDGETLDSKDTARCNMTQESRKSTVMGYG